MKVKTIPSRGDRWQEELAGPRDVKNISWGQRGLGGSQRNGGPPRMRTRGQGRRFDLMPGVRFM